MNTNICNKCGKENLHTEEIHISFNYPSKHDMEAWMFNLCDDCLDEFISTFVIKPTGYNTTGYEDYWNELQVAYNCK